MQSYKESLFVGIRRKPLFGYEEGALKIEVSKCEFCCPFSGQFCEANILPLLFHKKLSFFMPEQ